MPGSRSPKRKPGQRREAQLQAGPKAAQSFWSANPRRRARDRGCPQSGTGKPTRLWNGCPYRIWSRPRPWIGMPPRFWIGTGIWSEVYGRLRKRRHRKRKERNRKKKRRHRIPEACGQLRKRCHRRRKERNRKQKKRHRKREGHCPEAGQRPHPEEVRTRNPLRRGTPQRSERFVQPFG